MTDDSVMEEVVAAIRGATSIADIHALQSARAHLNHEVESCAVAAGAHARFLDPALAREIAVQQAGARALAGNPYLTAEAIDAAFAGVAEKFITMHVSTDGAAPRAQAW